MPPRARAAKSSKIMKENIGMVGKGKPKASAKLTRPTRKGLTDKTNSASDDNGSIEVPKKASKNLSSSVKPPSGNDNPIKPLREKRPPDRIIEENVARALSKNVISTKNNSTLQSSFKIPQKTAETSLVVARPQRVSRLPSRFEDHSMSPSKFIPVQPFHASTPISQKCVKPQKVVKESVNESPENELRQIARTKKDGKQVTKIATMEETLKKAAQITTNTRSDSNNNAKGRTLRSRQHVDVQKQKVNKGKPQKSPRNENTLKHKANKAKPQKSPSKAHAKVESPVKVAKKVVSSKISPVKKSRQKVQSPVKASFFSTTKSPVKKSPAKKAIQRPLHKDFSFKILEDNKKNESNVDVYEFTFDPNEEPAPQKKKKKVVKKKPVIPKPKTVVFKNNYDRNVNKALAALKNVVAKKSAQDIDAQKQKTNIPHIQVNETVVEGIDEITTQPNVNRNVPQIQRNVASKIIIENNNRPQPASTNTNPQKNVLQVQQNVVINSPKQQSGNHNINSTTMTGLINSANASKLPDQNKSTRVEDIEADFEPDLDLNYSPVNSPARPKTPVAKISVTSMPYNNDPLNLRENSFFEQNPVASSSINMSASAHHPQPSPWRVEFENLPLRWHVNSYVKSNMTPAVECSFINFDNKNKNKHVYTNLVPESNETLPEIVQKDQPNMFQTSMFEFIRQQVEKSSAKKNRGRSVTPVTASLFNDMTNKTPNKDAEKVARSTRQLFTPKKNKPEESETVDVNTSEDKENSKDSSRGRKRKNEDVENAPPKTPRKEKDNTYFGFEDNENVDHENVSPNRKVKGRKRALRPRARAVLKEINDQGPTRGAIPVAAKTALNAEVDRLYNEMKSASDAPVFPEKEHVNIGTTNISDPFEDMNEDLELSVHLFEDIEEIVHHVKPQRKSYGKAKKVTFRQGSTDSDTQDARAVSDHSDADDDLGDITFDPGVPFVEEKEKKKKKKLTKKQKMSKKEEEEAEAWAAGFNSMCEDVEEFALVIE